MWKVATADALRLRTDSFGTVHERTELSVGVTTGATRVVPRLDAARTCRRFYHSVAERAPVPTVPGGEGF
ncbi:hypothetical protein DWB78_06765 [Halopelagius longus]|uniref:Uncharacterized protein n=1 Tax=Halopelagius longus TaxID=1236180 RepID=A0A370IL73_9EURY|nr:hypothetical protein DWB78_06765 [Halopelagius longus]